MDNKKHCLPCEGHIKPFDDEQVRKRLSELDAWMYEEGDKYLVKIFLFKGFYRVMSFVNMVAWIVNNQNHHPEMVISYDKCEVRFYTHAANGITENDFICAKKIDELLGN